MSPAILDPSRGDFPSPYGVNRQGGGSGENQNRSQYIVEKMIRYKTSDFVAGSLSLYKICFLESAAQYLQLLE